MLLTTSVVAGLAALAAANPAPEERQTSMIEAYITKEKAIAFDITLANIGGTKHTRVPEANPGIVAASPSRVFPNYFYTWTRDSALTYSMIVDELIFGDSSLQKTVEDYTKAQAYLQTVTNPSGTLWPAGLGLGEMKFFLNRTRFNEDWGRPQRDGPALRATVFIKLCAALMAAGKTSVAKEIYWPLILNDLKYVGQYWNQTGYELWEEVHGTSFFTLNAQHRALTSGGYLAKKLGVSCKPCTEAPKILCLLQSSFWNQTGGYITADVNTNQITTRSGINASPLISSIQVFDISATCDASGQKASFHF
jgi:glucoamylase